MKVPYWVEIKRGLLQERLEAAPKFISPGTWHLLPLRWFWYLNEACKLSESNHWNEPVAMLPAVHWLSSGGLNAQVATLVPRGVLT